MACFLCQINVVRLYVLRSSQVSALWSLLAFLDARIKYEAEIIQRLRILSGNATNGYYNSGSGNRNGSGNNYEDGGVDNSHLPSNAHNSSTSGAPARYKVTNRPSHSTAGGNSGAYGAYGSRLRNNAATHISPQIIELSDDVKRITKALVLYTALRHKAGELLLAVTWQLPAQSLTNTFYGVPPRILDAFAALLCREITTIQSECSVLNIRADGRAKLLQIVQDNLPRIQSQDMIHVQQQIQHQQIPYNHYPNDNFAPHINGGYGHLQGPPHGGHHSVPYNSNTHPSYTDNNYNPMYQHH